MKSELSINFNKLWAINSEHDARYNTNTVCKGRMKNETENME